jgi:UDP-N-acetyl-D-galactosamine dehydrogenase
MKPASSTIAIIGLGYVGLPLAVAFARKYPVIGFDILAERRKEIQSGEDSTLEVDGSVLKKVLSSDPKNIGLYVAYSEADIGKANVYIITVPTPIDRNQRPDLSPLVKASQLVGLYLKKGDIVIYESTVFPGATEDICVPELEKASGLKLNQDFFAGYSPERVNPGDKKNTIDKITKIISGSNPEIAATINSLYKEIIDETFMVSSIKVAEAAKVFENAQRDLNIAYVNELAKICHLLEIDSGEVVDAMNTKWNALKFRPGLVGGHCISVDPYYLTHKAQEIGYHPEIILSGRRLNDTMGQYLANRVVKLMIKKGHRIAQDNILVLGITFKENCPDIRNTRVVDIVRELQSFGANVDVYDPFAHPEEVKKDLEIDLIPKNQIKEKYQAIIIAVAHEEFKKWNYKSMSDQNTVIFDIKGLLDITESDGRL